LTNISRTLEITAKSEEEALNIAESELNPGEIIISSEVISAPAKGLFGIVGKKEYKMKFNIGEAPEEAVAEDYEEDFDSEDLFDEDDNENEDDEPEKIYEAPARTSRNNFRREGYSRSKRGNNNRERNDRGDRGRSRRGGFRERDNFAQEEIDIPERPKEPVSEEIKQHERYSLMFELLESVSQNLDLHNMSWTEYYRDGAWVIEVAAEDVSQLIGKRGHTLDSVQYLLNIIFNKGEKERVRIILDAEGYREKRYKKLMMLATRMSRKVKASRRPVELEAMTTMDRRVIHMALKDNPDVETFSKGHEPNRRVFIAPSKNRNKQQMDLSDDFDFSDDLTDEDSDFEFADNSTGKSAVPMFHEEDV